MAWAYARQAQLAQDTSDRLNLNCGHGRLIVYKTIFSDVGEPLLRKLFRAISLASVHVREGLRTSKPQEISSTAWAFAVLGLKDTMFMEAAKAALIERSNKFLRGEKNAMTSFKGQDLANILWAMATLNVSPGNTLEALMPYLQNADVQLSVMSVAKQFNRQELANMAWACAVYGTYPDELMSFLYTGLLGPPGESSTDPRVMKSVHQDAGLQIQEVTTLVYIQADMDLQGRCQHLSLPVNFPDGWAWSKSLAVTPDELKTDDSLKLSLTTSKIQRAVSAAFSRIGFKHILEHMITMAKMAGTDGVRIPLKQMDVLSIDIASIENKIAIEVNGPSHYITRIDSVGAENLTSDESGYAKVVNGKLEYRFRWNGEIQEMNGSTALKDRLLTSLGWTVIHIPFWDWEALGGDFSAQEKFCSDLLDCCAVTE